MASRRKPERIKVTIFKTSAEIHRTVALKISSLIETRLAMGENVVLGLPTGSTPIGIYRELIRMHNEEGLDFSNVTTFNLDEYFGVLPHQMQSYHRFMYENFFNHVNIKPNNIHILPGDIALEDVEEVCEKYESDIRKAGGLDLTILGIGRDGHIAFNEPGSDFRSDTRMVILDETTRKDASSDFYGEDSVPFEALTMGIQTILNSKELILCATSETKADIIRKAVEGKQSEEIPATALQTHSNSTIFLNVAAAGRLTRLETPWEVRSIAWDEGLARKAIAHICKMSKKGIFELDVRDFDFYHLRELVYHYKGVDRLCRTVFDDFMGRVHRLEMLPKKSRVLIFSPHPDDDVICMV
jgi:glucosamine-6-phosphate deaminase